jgi:hypothetical protein
MMSRIPWTRLVELAELVEREHATSGGIDVDAALRLVRGILQFQEQLVAGMVRPVRGA